jgi:hypothetical protein
MRRAYARAIKPTGKPASVGYQSKRRQVMTEIEVLREEYKRAQENPLFDNPAQYVILLDLILDRIEELGGQL